jgi:hypothetical protein
LVTFMDCRICPCCRTDSGPPCLYIFVFLHLRGVSIKVAEMSMPEFVDEALKWAGTNKDALLALGAFLAAFLAPVTAIIAAAVSYRAVVTGPRVQMRIAQQQNELAERQQALHEKQFALTEQQARIASIGASEQKWISDFQEMLAHLFELGFRASLIILRLKESSDQQKTAELLVDLNNIHIEAANLIYIIEFHLGRERRYVRYQWVSMLLLWFFPNVKFDAQSFDRDVWSKQQRDIFERAQLIISEHEAKIPFNRTAAGDEEQELAALEKRAAGLHMEEQELAALAEKHFARLHEDLKSYGSQH